MTKLARALLPQWQAVYTKRTFKTGVSELLREFDSSYLKALGNPLIYKEEAFEPTKQQAGDGYNKAHGLNQKLTDIVKKGPKASKWTDKEQVFLKALLSDLSNAMIFLSKHK